jgi:hypothetical protein
MIFSRSLTAFRVVANDTVYIVSGVLKIRTGFQLGTTGLRTSFHPKQKRGVKR